MHFDSLAIFFFSWWHVAYDSLVLSVPSAMDGVSPRPRRPRMSQPELLYTFHDPEEVLRRLRSVNRSEHLDIYYTLVARQLVTNERNPEGVVNLLFFYQMEAVNAGMPTLVLQIIAPLIPAWVKALVGDDPAFEEAAQAYFQKSPLAARLQRGSRFSDTAEASTDFPIYELARRVVDIFAEIVQSAPWHMEIDFKVAAVEVNPTKGQTTAGIMLVTSTYEYVPDSIVTPWGFRRIAGAFGYTGSISSLTTAYLARLEARQVGYIDEYAIIWEVRAVDGIALPTPTIKDYGTLVEPSKVDAAWRELTKRYERENGRK